MKAFWFYGRFSEAMSFSKFATSVSKVTTDVPQISIVWLPPGKVSALALKNEDSLNKEKHSLRNFAVLQSRGSYSAKFLPTSIVTFDRKEANFENDIDSERMALESKRLHENDWSWCHSARKNNFLRINALTNLI